MSNKKPIIIENGQFKEMTLGDTISPQNLGAGDTDNTKYLRADGKWATPATSGLSDGDKGDITVSGSGSVWTIDNLAVTDAKINDVAATKITQDSGHRLVTDTEKSTWNNKADLVGGKVPSSQIPDIAITEFLGSVSSQSAMLALVGQKGDWCIRTDVQYGYVIVGTDPSLIGDWQQIVTPASPVTTVNSQVGNVILGKADIGLSNVVNADTTTTLNIIDSLNKRFVTDAQQTVLSNTSGTNSGNETTSTIGSLINGSTAATPNDTDLVATAEASVLKKITWTNVKAFLKTYFDTLYQAAGSYLTSANISDTVYGVSWSGVTTIAPSKNAVYNEIETKQDTLISATNIKTINGSSILGSGNLTVSSGYTLVATLASDQATGANITPVSLTGLVFNYEANSKYRIWAMGRVSPAAATTGCGFQFDLSSAITAIDVQFFHQLANTGTLTGGHSIADDASVGISSGLPGTSTYPVTVHGLLITGANTGTAQLRFRSETTAVITCKSGFTLVVEKIG